VAVVLIFSLSFVLSFAVLIMLRRGLLSRNSIKSISLKNIGKIQ